VENITNMGYGYSASPDTVGLFDCPTCFMIGNYGGQSHGFIDLGVNTFDGMAIYEFDNLDDGNETVFYTTSIFNGANLTWNNQPTSIGYITTYQTALGWNYLNFSSASYRYIELLSFSTIDYYSNRSIDKKPYVFVYNTSCISPTPTPTATPAPIIHTTDSETQDNFFSLLFVAIAIYILTFFVTLFDKR
jgi:hypothetical protein